MHRMLEDNGVRGTFHESPLKSAFRDAHVITTHVGFNNDVAGRKFGGVVLGLDNQVAMLG